MSSISPRSLAVIGAGPAGLMAAERLAAEGHAVTVYDAMPSPARKFLMAGRGGLNLTHSEPLDRFLARYSGADGRVEQAIRAFPPEALRAWAEDLGQPTFIGSSGRVFPMAMKASPLLRAWLQRLEGASVVLALRHRWQGWTSDGHLLFETPAGRVTRSCEAAVLALGGGSWPRLGSDGRWVPILEASGVDIAALTPSNVGVRLSWSDLFADKFEGHPLKRIAMTVGAVTRRGEAVVTRGGLEGGIVYALSAAIRQMLDAQDEAKVTVDLRPDLDEAELGKRLERPRGSQSLSTFLRKTAGLAPVAVGLLRESGKPPADPHDLARRIKALPLHVHGVMPIDRAISSAGGVRFTEIDGRYMLRSRPGTFICGEMLDWDAPTGGYLLQASFATGAAAASGVCSWLAEDAKPN
ncbi:NAD(P)/FAD-dependent oxidoreductase [Agaricicola taiwanensis]|uniref:NAD(P)/FAD-dependent oxidoreductase n=1 Tax=Agaricicola taiwanensis TaxID=591372 RepID=UPI001E47B39C|nr:TIGR03862 family flavoprotein [Agaricicola taiwanensis]